MILTPRLLPGIYALVGLCLLVTSTWAAPTTFDQALWTGGRITAGIEAVDSRFDAAGMAIDEARLELALRVIAASSEATRQAAETARRDVRERVSLDWNEWTAARSRMDNAEQARGTSVEVSESYARQYTAGRKTWLDVLNVVRETTLAEQALVDARSQMQAAVLRLKAQTGGLGLEAMPAHRG